MAWKKSLDEEGNYIIGQAGNDDFGVPIPGDELTPEELAYLGDGSQRDYLKYTASTKQYTGMWTPHSNDYWNGLQIPKAGAGGMAAYGPGTQMNHYEPLHDSDSWMSTLMPMASQIILPALTGGSLGGILGNSASTAAGALGQGQYSGLASLAANAAGGGMGDLGAWFSSLFGGGGGEQAISGFNMADPSSWGGGLQDTSMIDGGIGSGFDFNNPSTWGGGQQPGAGGMGTSGGGGWGSLLNGAGQVLGGGGAAGLSGLGALLGAGAGALGARGAPTSATMTTDPWGPASPYLQMLMGQTANYTGSPLPYSDPSQMVAGFNQNQNAAFGQGQNWASSLAMPTMNNAFSALNPILGGSLLDVNNNPALKGAIQAAVDPMTEAFGNSVMPAIRGHFGQQDATNNTRQGVAEGIASRGLTRNIGNVASTMSSNAYGQGLNATQNFFGMTPSLLNASAMPWQQLLQMGTQQQQNEQAFKTAPAAFDSLQAGRLSTGSNIIGNAARGGSSTTAPTPYQSPWLTALGGGVAGSQIGKLF